MNNRDQTRVYAVKLRSHEKKEQPLKELMNFYGKKIKRIRRAKDKDRGALLVNLKDCSRMSTLQSDLGEKYLVKQFKKDDDSDQFSSNDVNLQLENEAKDLEIAKIKQEHETNLLRIRQEYEQRLLEVQIKQQQKALEIEQQNLGVEHQVEQSVLHIEHTAELDQKKENMSFLDKIKKSGNSITQQETLSKNFLTEKQGMTKKIKKDKKKKKKKSLVRLEIPKSPLRTEESAQNHASNMREAREKNDRKKSPFSDPTGKFRTQKLLQKQKN